MANEDKFVQDIASREEDYSQWYIDLVRKAQLADYSPVRGCMVIRPYGYEIWERMQAGLDARIKATGHKNAYFPVFIPESLLKREAEHVEGFAPEVAVVTRGGNEELTEPLVVRPTSEAIIGSMYARWIQSYRDLPVLLNQWCNVVRWEKVTRPFLRTSEFLWQEGHTAHRTEEEALAETRKMLDVYADFVENDLAVPVIKGRKSESEKFAGAASTYSIEALMGDGKALQAGTSHFLGQHFARAFEIKFLDDDGTEKYVWQTSWGVSTRLIGALIMVHGDERGLRLPPKVAPIQAVIVPIMPGKSRERVLAAAGDLYETLKQAGLRVELDTREYTPGYKFNEWEMRGVPVRVELGPRDLDNNQITIVRRDNLAKTTTPIEGAAKTLVDLMPVIQAELLAQAKANLEENTREAVTYDELKSILAEHRGLVYAHWCGAADCEKQVKEETMATIRNIPLGAVETPGHCIVCGKATTTRALFARAY